jgi:23S rRNA (uracil1939-C5)-methyltransferase
VISTLGQGQIIALTIEKPAVGGRMIARAQGQVVLVDGAVPGERVTARIERVARGVAYAETLTVEEPSPDRQLPPADRWCGGCLYAHIAYPRQLQIKSLVVADAFARIGRLSWSTHVPVAASPSEGYRMRARLHWRRRTLGFFREGTHDVCDARATGQLLPASCDALDRIGSVLSTLPPETVREIELSESIDASQRVVHLDASPGRETPWFDLFSGVPDVSGITVADPLRRRPVAVIGTEYLFDELQLKDHAIALRRHGLAFFQANRFLIRELVSHVVDQIPQGSRVADLYAGGGVFAIAAARLCGASVTAVEGDRLAAEDLVFNAEASGQGIVSVHESVENYARSAPLGPDVIVVDPPRTGMSPEAVQGVIRLSGRSVVYISCDIATLARDARRLVDAGYDMARVDAFDLFPNTPHIETVVRFERR